MKKTRYKRIIGHTYRHIWCVGDIHGGYSLLMSGLSDLSFDMSKDLLITVGDTIDRGNENVEVLRLLEKPWFQTVVGNHEEMALDAIETQDGNLWDMNGGGWFFKLTAAEQREAIELLTMFKEIPHVIEVVTENKKIVIAHADYPKDSYLFGRNVDNHALLWSCDRILASMKGGHTYISGADSFIFGHMIVENVTQFSNQLYIDTGASNSSSLSFYQIK